MARASDKKDKKPELIIHGRLINHSVFEMDKFDEKSTPAYKTEVAFPKTGEEQLGRIADLLYAEMDKLGMDEKLKLDIDGGNIVSGLLDGEVLKKKREKNGKSGDAYAGCWVVRSNTIYNKDGVKGAPGGIQVWDEDLNPITILNQKEIWPGCQVDVAVSLDSYDDDDNGEKAFKFYLTALQKTGGDPEKDKLVSAKDTSTLFKPVGRTAGAAAPEASRRRRPG